MAEAGAGAGGGGGALSDNGAIDYTVHEAWNEATNVYLLVVLASLALLVYARRNKRKIMRIFTLPPTADAPLEPDFYDSMKKIRLRQQLEMYSIETSLNFISPEGGYFTTDAIGGMGEFFSKDASCNRFLSTSSCFPCSVGDKFVYVDTPNFNI
ncbi:small integral membrane protein 19 isoform X1 [Pelodiscus sinensis]|uniref:small integral membrane protein 19 isoform X1 n=1 Tax=Pelodiscus sinensis TaxID=13735 RepID=UPI003F6A7022